MRLNDAELHMCAYIQSLSHGEGLSGGAFAKIGLPTHGEGAVLSPSWEQLSLRWDYSVD